MSSTVRLGVFGGEKATRVLASLSTLLRTRTSNQAMRTRFVLSTCLAKANYIFGSLRICNLLQVASENFQLRILRIER